jgi:prepilin-type processing-associated H-X9-DG protein
MKTLIGLLAAALLLLLASCLLLTWEAPFALLLGWIGFLRRVLPLITVDWPSVLVGCVAIALFALGVHWIGRAWQRDTPRGEGASARPWKVRWSLALVVLVFLLFAAGIAMVGTVHQVGWLLAADSLFGETVPSRQPSTSNLKWLGIAMHDHASAEAGVLPPGGTFTPQGDMGHSWETYLLPYIGYATRGIDMNRPWNDPVNQKYFKCVIPQFVNAELTLPSLTDAEGYGLSHYSANSRVFAGNKKMKLEEITNGTANTLLIGEVNANLQPWGHPVNWRDPVHGINRSVHGFGGASSAGGANFLMADGSVRFVSDQISPEALRALSNPQHPAR